MSRFLQSPFAVVLSVAALLCFSGCGDNSVASYQLEIHPLGNRPPVAGEGIPYSQQFEVTGVPSDVNVTWAVEVVGSKPQGTFAISDSGMFTLTTTSGGEDFVFRITATAPGGSSVEYFHEVNIYPREIPIVNLSIDHRGKLGGLNTISITKTAGHQAITGFSFLIGFDTNTLSLVSATPGERVQSYKWDYFATEEINDPDWSANGMKYVRITAIANTSIPDSANPKGVLLNSPLVDLNFQVANDEAIDCSFLPVRFFWQNCSDNWISVNNGFYLTVSRNFDWEWDFDYGNTAYELSGLDCDSEKVFVEGGACGSQDCLQLADPGSHASWLTLSNGGISLTCYGNPDIRGDVNLDGLSYGLGDLENLREYLLRGNSVLSDNPSFRAEQIHESDVNFDSLTLTVADMVYIERVIVGDALNYPRLPAPFATGATLKWNGDVLTVQSQKYDIGAVYLKLNCDSEPTVTNLSFLEMLTNFEDGVMRVLLYSDESDFTRKLTAGEEHQLFSIQGDYGVEEIQVSTYEGTMMLPRF